MHSPASRRSFCSVLVLAGALTACSRSAPVEKGEPAASAPAPAQASTAAHGAPSVPASAASAKLGELAPDFSLRDLAGAEVKLSSFRGKIVVLEWFNPGCPFVKASHTKGSLVDTAARHTKQGVVWLGINSAGPGKQGYGKEANEAGQKAFSLTHPILLDESGDVGHLYGAAHTPHVFVIDALGKLVYRGAIDNSPDGEGEAAAGGKLINYVDAALADIGAAREVAVPETEAYGCSVKYQG